jgi:hypothetical protein
MRHVEGEDGPGAVAVEGAHPLPHIPTLRSQSYEFPPDRLMNAEQLAGAKATLKRVHDLRGFL